ncbi:hypothetical protein DFQ28_008972 [Apophysomyces sp. BC1034]|nr:hypothetical protein DFQ30_008627 [Apophysomyces sp. BC1015]KAG0174063.1 hypothetical protein DFQ29_007603 [Apophysomyces sp. BC1021]KAG0185679.1 hypothetical protein DFQ28_008972 [Apophysomyces sp. BC1034]
MDAQQKYGSDRLDDQFVLPIKRDLEDKYIEESRRKRNKVNRAAKVLHFKVNSAILPECYNSTIDIKSDSWCGFQTIALLVKGDEDAFPMVKADMLKALENYAAVYKDKFHYDIDELRTVVSYGRDLVKPYPPCPMDYWFVSPCFVQLAADTYEIPIAVYSNDESRNMTGDLVYHPLLDMPHIRPTRSIRPIPVVLHHVNHYHWATVDFVKSIEMIWPKIDYFSEEMNKQLNPGNLIRTFCRYLSIKKDKKSNQAAE